MTSLFLLPTCMKYTSITETSIKLNIDDYPRGERYIIVQNAHVSIPSSSAYILSIYTNKTRKLEGSCQCGGIQFTLDSHTPVPYQLCACSICRKVGGYNGSVNLGGIADSLKVTKGKELIK